MVKHAEIGYGVGSLVLVLFMTFSVLLEGGDMGHKTENEILLLVLKNF
jgi:hypothetical protein